MLTITCTTTGAVTTCEPEAHGPTLADLLA